MFTIVISEKGGAERREGFERNEINVGRVQGNDLMLPKGNVSKHHARLLYRDGRFIVTDLKSTNGTYVNGRKISQATIVREGDKIYIGDFVLRLETGHKASTATPQESGYAGDDGEPSASPASIHALSAHASSPQPPAGPRPLPPPAAPPSPHVAAVAAPVVAPTAGEGINDYPLEQDPDESESAPDLAPVPPSRVPAAQRMSGPVELRRPGNTMALNAERPAQRRATGPQGGPARVPGSVPPPAPSAPRAAPKETPQQAARRLALITLVDRVAEAVDLSALERSPLVPESLSQAIDRSVQEQSKAMRAEGEAPEGVDLELLARDAFRELVGLGPLAPLLEDEETSDIHVVRPDCVLAVKNGQSVLADPPFSSEAALKRVVSRLVHQSGEPLRPEEQVIERRLARGARVTAVAPPASSGWVLHIAKRRAVQASLGDLVQASSLSQTVSAFLEACARARANVLVVGAGGVGVVPLLAAIASAANPGERVAVLRHGSEDVVLGHAHVMTLAPADHGARGAEAVYAAARLGAERLIVASLGGEVAVAVLDVIAEGSEAVLAGATAMSLELGVARLAAQVAMARAGCAVDAARSAIAASFDIALEVDRGPGGRVRVRRVAEFAVGDEKGTGLRDLFVLNADSPSDAAYVATGASHFLARAGNQ